jgi:hypothetical protein
MCKDRGHKGQTLLLQNLPVPKDTNPVKGTNIQEYHVIQAESQLVLDRIPEILLSVGEVISPVHKLQSQLHEGDTSDPLLRYA